MSETSIVEFAEEWQTGFFLLVGTALVGLVIAGVVGSVAGGLGRYFGLFGGVVLAFLAFSYALYGR